MGVVNLSLEFKYYKIEDIGEVVSGGTPSTSKNEYWNGDIGWITPKDLSSYDDIYISRGERNISAEGLNNSSAKLVPKNTILMTSRAPIGYIAIANNVNNKKKKKQRIDEIDKIYQSPSLKFK